MKRDKAVKPVGGSASDQRTPARRTRRDLLAVGLGAVVAETLIGADEAAAAGVVLGATNTTNTKTAIVNASTSPSAALEGKITANAPPDTAAGVLGTNSAANGNGAGVLGFHSGGGTGVLGSGNKAGVLGRSSTLSGVGVRGVHTGGGTGVSGYVAGGGSLAVGIHGLADGTDANGIIAEAHNGTEAFAIWGKSTDGEAGHFTGKVVVNGDLVVLGSISQMDHPLDPENKYLSHSFVGSPDMMNVYNGNVVTDGAGLATVVLPRYFGTLNRDFRYQLTVIGTMAQAIVEREIRNNRFRIRSSAPNVKVSWQVTGIRQDPYANAHRVKVEKDKPRAARGRFLYPKGYNKPPELHVDHERHARLQASRANRR